MSVSLGALHIRAIVLDIEGTTTPVDFVYNVLFPYARAHADRFLAREWSSPACAEAVATLRREWERDNEARGSVPKDSKASQPFNLRATLAYVHWLMDRDRKSPGLKLLQGLIWQDGYASGELRGIVYPDVTRAFERWKAAGLRLFIYSSGSVLAQKLLFGSTAAGDLTRFLDGYFDTGVGPKQSTDSYATIVEQIRVPANHVLFVSDVAGELDAARAAGLQTALAVRGSEPANHAAHPVVRSFDEMTELS